MDVFITEKEGRELKDRGQLTIDLYGRTVRLPRTEDGFDGRALFAILGAESLTFVRKDRKQING